MKTRVVVMIAILVVFCFSQNLLQNPGFETWTGGMPDHWQHYDSIAIFQEDVIVHGGNFSAKDSLFTQTQTFTHLFQGRFAVSPNTEYLFTTWVFDNDIAGRIRQAIRWFIGADSQNVWSGEYSGNATNWQELTYTAISPSGADSALVFLRAYDSAQTWDGDAIFYVDDAYFAPSATQAPVIVRFWHTPTNPGSGVSCTVYAQATDDGFIQYDTLYYGVNDLSNPIGISHSSVGNDTFSYQIPGQSAGDTVFYYLRFIDDDALETISDTHSYYVGTFDITINEVYYDTPGTDSGCFIEIFGPASMTLDGFNLVGINGNNGSAYATIDLAGQVIPGDGFFVVGDNSDVPNVDIVDALANLQNGDPGDNLELRYYDITIDALGYGTLNGWIFTGEWLPAPDVYSGHGLGRYPDGQDTDNNEADFNDYDTLTPGTANPGVGIIEHEVKTLLPRPSISNPIRAGIQFSMLIDNATYYPVKIYNAMGQFVREIAKPDDSVILPTGVYFIRFSNTEKRCTKLVIVR